MMNRKLAVAMFVVPLGMSSLLTKSVSAEVAYKSDGQASIVVAQRYDGRWNNDQRDNDQHDQQHNDHDQGNRDQRYNNQRNRDSQEEARREEARREHFRRDELRQGNFQGNQNRWNQNNWNQNRWNQNRRDDQRVWVPGHYESGFLGIGRRWVEGYWATGR